MKASGSLVAITLAALATSLNVAHAQGRETITWYTGDFPPHTIYQGSEKDKGNHDLAIKDFMARMPQYDHKTEDAVTPQIVHSLTNEPSSCSLQVVKNAEREKAIAYSQLPHTYLLPNAMITLRKSLDAFKPFLNNAGEVKLDEALSSGKFKVAVSQGRSYGAAIDPVLKKHPSITMPLPANLTNRLGMMMRKLESQGEFDAGFGYAVEMAYQIRNHKLNPADYVAVPVASSTLVPLSVACSKSDSGKRILAELDKILSEPATQQIFDARYKSWLDPAAVPYYDEMLKQARKGK